MRLIKINYGSKGHKFYFYRIDNDSNTLNVRSIENEPYPLMSFNLFILNAISVVACHYLFGIFNGMVTRIITATHNGVVIIFFLRFQSQIFEDILPGINTVLFVF